MTESEARHSGLIHLHALAVLEYAEITGLSDVYDQVSTLVAGNLVRPENLASDTFRELVSSVAPEDLEEVLKDFLVIARDKLDITPVEIISAVPLRDDQLYRLQNKLIRKTSKQLEITTIIDPTLLGGVRVLVGNSVIDCSVKRKLLDIKQAIYEGVYQSDDRAPQ